MKMRAFVVLIASCGIAASAYYLGSKVSHDRRVGHASRADSEQAATESSPPSEPRALPVAVQKVAPVAALASPPKTKEADSVHERPPAAAPGSYDAEALSTELAAQYFSDSGRTRDSIQRESFLRQTFSQDGLKASLTNVECRSKICQGVLEVKATDAANVFKQTFLSQEFAEAVPDAITVTSRESLPNGTIRTTFYIHPQEVLVAAQQAAAQ